jgi:hypothetical protein
MGSADSSPPTISAGKNLPPFGLGKSELAEKEYIIKKMKKRSKV